MNLDSPANGSNLKKVSNKYYERDIKHTVQYPRLFLTVLGVWPLISKDLSTKQKCFSAVLILICLIGISLIIVLPLIHVILREKDLKSRIAVFTVIAYHIMNCFKYGFFVFRWKTIKLCMEHVETDWMRIETEHDRAIMMRNVNVGHNLTVSVAVPVWTIGIFYHTVLPLMSGRTINEYNETVKLQAYVGFDIFGDSQASPTYEIIFCTICISVFISYAVTSASCSFTAAFVSHACGQIQIIISQIEVLANNMNENTNCNQVRKRISFVTQCYVRVGRLVSNVEDVIREICFIEVVASTATMCFVEYNLVTEWKNSDAVGIMTFAVSVIISALNIFVFCYISENLIEQGHRIGDVAYMVDWCRIPGKMKLDIIMIIIMSNYPPKITAGRIFELSISSFGAIIKMSLSYCNMLRAMTD